MMRCQHLRLGTTVNPSHLQYEHHRSFAKICFSWFSILVKRESSFLISAVVDPGTGPGPGLGPGAGVGAVVGTGAGAVVVGAIVGAIVVAGAGAGALQLQIRCLERSPLTALHSGSPFFRMTWYHPVWPGWYVHPELSSGYCPPLVGVLPRLMMTFLHASTDFAAAFSEAASHFSPLPAQAWSQLCPPRAKKYFVAFFFGAGGVGCGGFGFEPPPSNTVISSM